MAKRKKKKAARKPMKSKRKAKKVEVTKMGAPTKYMKEFPELLIEHMNQGFSFDSFPATVFEKTSGAIRFGKTALYVWEKKYPEFANAKEIGQALSFNKWEKIAYDNLIAGTPFNAAVWIFNMKNRFGWRDKMEHTSPDGSLVAPQVILTLPDNGRGKR